MKITLIRHGETDFNRSKTTHGWTDTKLTRKGLMQAKRIGDKLKNEKFDAIYSSDLTRAFDTAQEIARFHPHLKIQKSAKLREQKKGIYEGKTHEVSLSDMRREGKKIWWEFTPKGGESYKQVLNRVVKFMEELSKKGHKNVAIITHGGPVNIFLGHITKTPKKEIKKFSLENTGTRVVHHIKGEGFKLE